MPVPRAIIYQDAATGLQALGRCSLARLDDHAVVERFQSALAAHLGTAHCRAFPRARLALYAILKRQGFPRGTKVIVPPITIAPIIQVIVELGLEPVFVDIELDTLCFDPAELRRSVDRDTRAILLTYLYGITPDLEPLLAIARQAGLLVIEDFSHNFNAAFNGRKLGTFGDTAIYSSSYTKTFDLFGGGLAFTNNHDLDQALQQEQAALPKPSRAGLAKTMARNLVYNLALRRPLFSVATFPAFFLMSRWTKGLFHKLTGPQPAPPLPHGIPDSWKPAFSSEQARLGLELLRTVEILDEQRIANYRTIVSGINNPALRFPRSLPECHNVYWQALAFCDAPEKMKLYLSRHLIDAGSTNLRLCSHEPEFGRFKAETRRAAYLKSHSFFIPIFPGLTAADLEKIIAVLNAYR